MHRSLRPTAMPSDHALQHFLDRHIPLARAMGVRVLQGDRDGVVLAAPLDVNANHHGTLFGGSASALATLAGWGWMHLRLDEVGLDPDLVIQRSDVEYVRPGRADVEASCPGTTDAAWSRFLKTYRRFGRARLELASEVRSGGKVVASMKGWFVALDPAGDVQAGTR